MSGDACERTTGEERAEAEERSHLSDVDDGCGCAEVWEHLSEEREAASETGGLD